MLLREHLLSMIIAEGPTTSIFYIWVLELVEYIFIFTSYIKIKARKGMKTGTRKDSNKTIHSLLIKLAHARLFLEDLGLKDNGTLLQLIDQVRPAKNI